MSILALARPEIVAMKPYSSARKEAPARGVLLNANESPWPLLNDGADAFALNRYPDPQPPELIERLASLYAVPDDHVLVTRGSDEGIDLLTRVFCRAGVDAILQCPPTFGMYRIAAETQGAAVISIPRKAEAGFAIDTTGMLEAIRRDQFIRLVFLTSPNNPTGDCVEESFLAELLALCANRAIVVVDEAYAEFCDRASAVRLLAGNPHLVVLRTLSKAWASAGLRCGAVLAQPLIIGLLQRIIAPYPLASPVAALALRVLEADQPARQQRRLAELRENKETLLGLLEGRRFVTDTWPGEANFVLLRVRDADGLLAHCARLGVILRGFAHDTALRDCIRITVGSKPDLAALKDALDQWESEIK
ncbi:MAG: histidinol-phosphate transaminase [Lysobacterales bacterium]